MPKEDNKILKDNHGEKSMKVTFIIYADLKWEFAIIILKSHEQSK